LNYKCIPPEEEWLMIPYKRIVQGIGEDELHPDIVEREQNRLIKFFKIKLERGKTGVTIKNMDDAIESITRTIKKAIEGYERAPDKGNPEETFMARINFMTRYSKMPELWEDKKAPKKKPTKAGLRIEGFIDQEIPDEDDEEKVERKPYLILKDKREKEFFEERKAFYNKEFEFNDSSDQMLLEAVIADEVLLRRHLNKNLADESMSEDLINDLQKRYRDNLRVLGVSRAQRIADDTNQKGNVAQLALALEEKLEEIKNLSDLGKRDKIVKKLITQFSLVNVEDIYNSIEEIEFMRQRAMRPDMENIKPIPTINELPAGSEIDAILKDMSKKELN